LQKSFCIVICPEICTFCSTHNRIIDVFWNFI